VCTPMFNNLCTMADSRWGSRLLGNAQQRKAAVRGASRHRILRGHVWLLRESDVAIARRTLRCRCATVHVFATGAVGRVRRHWRVELPVPGVFHVALASTPQTCTWKVAVALACGNTFVYKPSPWAPMSCVYLAELLTAAGAPPGALNIVQGDASTGEALCAHAALAKVSFTGSVATGEWPCTVRQVRTSTCRRGHPTRLCHAHIYQACHTRAGRQESADCVRRRVHGEGRDSRHARQFLYAGRGVWGWHTIWYSISFTNYLFDAQMLVCIVVGRGVRHTAGVVSACIGQMGMLFKLVI
jgi:hypothetical protein